jgi:hypothetical protein
MLELLLRQLFAELEIVEGIDGVVVEIRILLR